VTFTDSFSNSVKENIVGGIVIGNFVIFYGAPLSTIATVQNSRSIRVPMVTKHVGLLVPTVSLCKTRSVVPMGGSILGVIPLYCVSYFLMVVILTMAVVAANEQPEETATPKQLINGRNGTEAIYSGEWSL
jgi:hypothetical protein